MNSTPVPSPPSFRRWAIWLLLGLVLAVAVFAAAAINSLNLQADAFRHMETALARLEHKAHELNALEWQILHKREFTPKLVKSVAAARLEMQKQFNLLGDRNLTIPEIEEMADRYRAYSKFVDQEFQLLQGGDTKAAEEWDEEKVDPAFDELSKSLDKSSKAFDALAVSALRRVGMWTFVILIAAAAIAGFLFWQYYDKQRAAELAVTEQRVLREANEELEVRVLNRTAELAMLNKRIGVSARQAGMAEVANSVLHNVGNALNSINVSVSLVLETLAQSRLVDLPAAAGLLREHTEDLATFLTKDEQGRQFPNFLEALAGQWQTEQAALTREATVLHSHIQHVREIIQRQQAISGMTGIIENVPMAEVINEVLALNQQLLGDHRVQLRSDVAPGLSVLADRSKLTQILVNIVRNAVQAIAESGTKSGDIKVWTEVSAAGRALIHVTDNGLGIPAENLTKIFSYGFTTKKDGHGFGLHGSALGAQEMGGSLCAQSAGLGCGATFTLDLPVPVSHPQERPV